MAVAVNGGGLTATIGVTRSTDFSVDVQLSIPPGKTVALLGPNGAGKSTTVAALAGLIPIDSGRIELGGRVLDSPEEAIFVRPEERRIGVVFQDYLLFPHMTALENVKFGLRTSGRSAVVLESEARDWLGRMDLADRADAMPADLSGGEAQRVALARALAVAPSMLLLDEPLAALDVTTRTSLRRRLGEHLEAFAGPRLLITHDPVEAFLLADEVYVVEDGAITQVGSADDIRLRPRTRYAADLAGANLLGGRAKGGVVTIDQSHEIHIAEREIEGPVLITIHPTAISVHRTMPVGSPRNTWPTTVERIERLGERVRMRTGPPVPLTVEITSNATEALALGEGTDIWIAIKATEIGVEPDVT